MDKKTIDDVDYYPGNFKQKPDSYYWGWLVLIIVVGLICLSALRGYEQKSGQAIDGSMATSTVISE